MSTIEHLIRQANRIALFFDAYPDREQAIDSVADHIRKFWAPSLRSTLLDFLKHNPQGNCNGLALHALAKQALVKHSDSLAPGSLLGVGHSGHH